MARTKSTKTKNAKKTSKKVLAQEKVNETAQFKLSEQVKLSESYISLALGAAVVVVLAIAFFALVKGESTFKRKEVKLDASPSASVEPTEDNKGEQTYILPEGEGLWDVAVKFYGDGYKWTIIGEANGFGEYDHVPPGTKLIIPPLE